MHPYYHSVSPSTLSGEQLDQMLALGWYRMHQDIFTTSHVQMDEVRKVHWLRYAVPEITEHASHRRIKKRNQQFQHIIQPLDVISEGDKELYGIYRASINFEGASSIQESLYGDEYFTDSIYTTYRISIYSHSNLIALGFFDVGKNSAASILHCFNPAFQKFSLGKYLILLTIDFLKQNNYTWYYPGYLTEGFPKMNYKLFLGKEQAQYFSPEEVGWKYFDESILGSRNSKITNQEEQQ